MPSGEPPKSGVRLSCRSSYLKPKNSRPRRRFCPKLSSRWRAGVEVALHARRRHRTGTGRRGRPAKRPSPEVTVGRPAGKPSRTCSAGGAWSPARPRRPRAPRCGRGGAVSSRRCAGWPAPPAPRRGPAPPPASPPGSRPRAPASRAASCRARIAASGSAARSPPSARRPAPGRRCHRQAEQDRAGGKNTGFRQGRIPRAGIAANPAAAL